MRRLNSKIKTSGLTILEMVLAMAIMGIVFAVVFPQFVNIQSSWASKQANSETIQNGNVFAEQLSRCLTKAVKVTAVSSPSAANGFIEFEDSDGVNFRCDISAENLIEFGPVGSLSDLAGPVSTLRFTCYDACDLSTPLSLPIDVNTIRFIKTEATFTNPAAAGKIVTLSTYLHTNGNQTGTPVVGGVAYMGFTEAKAASAVTSITIATPATNPGDLLIAAVATDNKTSTSLTPPAGKGWTLISLGAQGSNVTLGVWWKLAVASESATHRFTWSGSQQAYAWMMRFTGHDSAHPINAYTTQGSGNNDNPQSSSVTPTVVNAMILRLGAFDDDDIALDTPGLAGHNVITMDKSTTGNNTVSAGAGYILQAAAAASGTSTFSLTSNEQSQVVTVAIAPVPGTGGTWIIP